MKKKLFTAVIAGVMAMAMSMTALAAGWQKNDTGWWYATNDAGTQWHANGWQWIDGNGDGTAECYYFDGNGYMLAGTTTPDGYTVNADGAWVSGGTVQTQQAQQAQPVQAMRNTGEIQYDSNGFSLTALDMLNNTREANAKYGEVSEMDIADQIYVTYSNGLNASYWKENKFGDTAADISASSTNRKLIFCEDIAVTGGESIAQSLKAKGYDAYSDGAVVIVRSKTDSIRVVINLSNGIPGSITMK